MTFREFETACEQSSACSHMNGLSKTRCIRECVSPSCYRELYQTDPVRNKFYYLMFSWSNTCVFVNTFEFLSNHFFLHNVFTL